MCVLSCKFIQWSIMIRQFWTFEAGLSMTKNKQGFHFYFISIKNLLDHLYCILGSPALLLSSDLFSFLMVSNTYFRSGSLSSLFTNPLTICAVVLSAAAFPLCWMFTTCS